MAFHDLREFMESCDKAGELVSIDREVDWNLEAGAICRRIAEIGAPMAHMKNIRGCADGMSILGSPISKGWHGDFSRVALALEMDPDTPYEQLVEEFVTRMANPVRPIEVATGPCKENVIRGADINLFKFPAPYLHLGDGGRYINTGGVTSIKDPDSNWTNWGVYRHMIHKKSILGGIVNPFQHIGMIYYQKYEARGENMPFSIFFGGCPTTFMVGSMSIPAGETEANAAGGLRRAPVQLVKCETNDLLVPATAEIVIEGHVRPHERWDEGPFGEATGYRASPRMPRPVFRVDCITHRNDPIMPVSCPGTDLDECEILLGVFSLTTSVRRELRDWGLPVVNAFSPPGLKFALLVVTVEKGHPGIADRVASVVRASKMGVFFQYIVVIEDDVNATNYPEALHAAFTRCDPGRGIQIFPLAPGHPLIPFLDLHDKMNSRGAAMTIDATTPPEWTQIDRPERMSFAKAYPQDLQARICENWDTAYGLPARAGRFR
ncbi:MAG: UbiD family decarboxylase [Gammaproteobacteria bacterium]|nr:UbiD family decarboxylase [Gammaproteobacteria bacterium]